VIFTTQCNLYRPIGVYGHTARGKFTDYSVVLDLIGMDGQIDVVSITMTLSMILITACFEGDEFSAWDKK